MDSWDTRYFKTDSWESSVSVSRLVKMSGARADHCDSLDLVLTVVVPHDDFFILVDVRHLGKACRDNFVWKIRGVNFRDNFFH